MKGMIFNIFEDFVTENFGADAWETVLSSTELKTDGVFAGPGTYPDEDLFALATTAANAVGLELTAAVRVFGKYLFPRLHERAPMFAEQCSSAKEFLMTVESAIHVEVRKLYPESYVPVFDYHDPGPNQLVLEYRSKRKLCSLVEGLIDGVGEHYHEQIAQEHTVCVHRGSDHCEFNLRFGVAA